ncbi:MAG TPA: hypothetical protein VEG34_18440 [Thermoanaerobaculia bacterium]|nr:hypothetical protein [Thermoanaerobaculia bacterium]
MTPKTVLYSLALLPAALLLAACAAQPAGAPETGSAPVAAEPVAAAPAAAVDSTSVPVSNAAGAETAAGPEAGPALPPGVRRVIFGTSYKPRSATGVPRCSIQVPLDEPPVFDAGAREVAWIAMVDTAVVADLKGTVVGDSGGELAMEPCEIYAVCGSGGACRAQYGAVLRRQDGQPLRPGTYRLEIEVAGQKATLPFEVAAQ